MSSVSSPLSTQQRLQQLTSQQKVALQQHLQAQKAKLAAQNGLTSPQQTASPNTPVNGQLAIQQQLKQVRGKIGNYNFATTTQEILRKYAKYPPSLTFHIYDTHYRFNNTQDSNVIPKDSPMVKSFLQHIIKEEIPSAMTELLKDFYIKFYDGCLILQVYDHRNMISPDGKDQKQRIKQEDDQKQQQQNKDSRPEQNQQEKANQNQQQNDKASASPKDQKKPDPALKPKAYRTLLRPTPLSLYYDLLYHTDSALTRFTDPLSLQMESEILALTQRKLDLSVPLNPYELSKRLFPEHEYPKKVWDEKKQDYKLIHSHREETPTELRKLHQDRLTMHKSTEYEDLMLLLSNKQRPASDTTSEKQLVVVGPSTSASTSSDPVSLEGTPAAGTGSGESSAKKKESTSLNTSSVLLGGTSSTQFMRLRFIEEIRKRKESQKAQTGAAVAAQTGAAPANNPAGGMVKNGTLGAAAAANFQRQQQLKQQALAKLMTAQLQQQQQVQQQQQQRIIQQQAQQLQQNTIPPKSQNPQLQTQQQQFALHATPLNQSPPQAQLAQQVQAAALNRAMLPQAGAQGYQSPQMQQNMRRANYMNQMNQNVNPASRVGDFNANMSPRVNAAVNPQLTPQMNQAMSPQLNQAMRPSPTQTPQMTDQAAIRAQQLQLQQNRQMQLQRQQSLQAQQEQLRKRQRTNMMGQQIPQQGRTPQMGNASPPPATVGTPVMQNGSVSTPRMGSQLPQLVQSMPNQAAAAAAALVNQRPATQPGTTPAAGQPQSTLQHQQQQIFQITLTPQEQQEFRQIQAKMNQLVQMGNTGVAPNKTRLSPQHQQQAIQHAKMLQQQLLQRFPNYFQKLRQLQQIQQQRRQALQRQQQLQQQQRQQQQSTGAKSTQNQGLGNLDALYNQQNMGMNMTLPAMQQQMMSLPMMGQMNMPNQQQPKR